MTDVEEKIRELRMDARYWEAYADRIGGLGPSQRGVATRYRVKARQLRKRALELEQEIRGL